MCKQKGTGKKTFLSVYLSLSVCVISWIVEMYRGLNPMHSRNKADHTVRCTEPNAKWKFQQCTRHNNIIINREDCICVESIEGLKSVVQIICFMGIELEWDFAVVSVVVMQVGGLHWLHQLQMKRVGGRFWFTPNHPDGIDSIALCIMGHRFLQQVIPSPCVYQHCILVPASEQMQTGFHEKKIGLKSHSPWGFCKTARTQYTPSPIGKLELHDILLLSANAQNNITFSISACVSVLVCLSGNVETKPPEQTPKVEPNVANSVFSYWKQEFQHSLLWAEERECEAPPALSFKVCSVVRVMVQFHFLQL